VSAPDRASHDGEGRPEPQIAGRAALLEAVLAQAYNAVVITDARFDHGGPLMTYVNPAFCVMTGYPEEELIGRSPRMLQGPATDPAVIDRLRACLRTATFFEGETVNYRKDGTPYRVRWNISPVRAADGTLSHFVSVQRETTAEAQLQAERTLLARALDGAFEAIAVLDLEGRFTFVNEAWVQLAGEPREHLLGRSWTSLDAGDDEAAREWNELLASSGGRSFVTLRRADGTTRLVDRSVAPIMDPVAGEHFVVVAKDVTDRLRQVETLLERADLDALTGALTRGAGERELMDAMGTTVERGEPLVVLLADIDHFKRVNDTLGHGVGDRVLAAVADALRRCVRVGDAVVRWGGEEFLLVLPGATLAVAERVAHQVRAELAAGSDAGVPVVTASIGVASWTPGETPEALVARADGALYAAKAAGRDAVRVANA
jgi:diguanylate cyclase (GGDEF)-like protein/PAS domain S-box-containing protein